MICDVCGRNNPDRLTFCQDCGRRLKPRGRQVPPTPPSGLPKVDLPATSPAPPEASGRGERPSTSPRIRPEAPVFSFAPPDASEAARHVQERPRPERDAGALTCPTCQGSNPAGYRFCMTCGTPLAGGGRRPAAAEAAQPRPAAQPEPPPGTPRPSPSSTEPMPAEAQRIVPARVVDIAASRAAPLKLIACSRCGGQCSPGTRFCKYCGAPLGEEAAAAVPVPAPSDPGRPVPRPVESSPKAPPPLRVSPPPPIPSLEPPPRPAPQPRPEPVSDPAPEARRLEALDGRAARFEPTPAPQRGARGRLVVIVEDGSEGKSFPLADRPIDIGRTEGDIRLEDDPYVSPRHARLVPEPAGDGRAGAAPLRWTLRDLDSTNGVYIRLKKPHPLRDGDLLLLGLEVLQFQIVSEAERGLGHAMQHGTLLFGSPAAPRSARLCQRTIEGITRDVYHLVRDETIIGRETGDIVFTADPFLSRRHAVIRHNPSTREFTLTDLESSNGTFVAIREEITLQNGDFVRIGQHLFRVDLG